MPPLPCPPCWLDRQSFGRMAEDHRSVLPGVQQLDPGTWTGGREGGKEGGRKRGRLPGRPYARPLFLSFCIKIRSVVGPRGADSLPTFPPSLPPFLPSLP